jgi:penicillin-binding protein 1A
MKKRGKSLKTTIKSKVDTLRNERRQDVRLHQHLLSRYNSKKELRLRKKAEYYASLPKGRLKRLLYRMHPKRVARFIFSREGSIFLLRWAGIGILVFMVATFVVFAYFRKDLPKNITDLRACSQGQKTSYYDRTGEVLLWRGDGDIDCRPIPLDQVSPYLQKAVIAAEDESFYKHPGFDIKGIASAALSNAGSDGQGRGGSTITQQYVKLAVLNNSERSITRKIKELILAIELERSYKKDEILQAYLNEIGFGGVYNGAEAAAQGIFGKPAKDLTLDESATFAAAIQAPGAYWDNDREGLIERRDNYVLPQMVKTGAITKEEAEAAKKVDTLAKVVPGKSKYKDIKAPHFVIEVQRQLEEEFGTTNIQRQGYKVITTLDMNLQAAAETSVSNTIGVVDGFGLDNAALVSEEVATGQVVAYVGSRDFNYPVFGEKNLAGTPRSPGSSFKPYDYAALMASSQNWGAGSILYDYDTTWSGFGSPYKPKDYDLSQPGPVSMRYALGGSRNTPAIKAMYIAGIEKTQQLTEKLGVKSGVTGCSTPKEKDCGQILSTAIGDGGEIRLDEHVHGYATLSRNGKNIPQQFVLKIMDSKGKVIRDNTGEPAGEQAVDPQIAYIVSDMLSDPAASYFRNSPSYKFRVLGDYDDRGIPSAIKTGTTNSRENGWMLGYSPKYATGVWVGHHENKSANNANMEYMTGPMWADFMKVAHANVGSVEKWPQPAGIKTVAHDNAFYAVVKSACTGVRLGNVCGYSQSDIYPDWYTPRKSTGSTQKVVIDTVSGKRATDCTPASARKEITGGGIIVPELDSSDPNYNNFMAPIRGRLKASTGEAIPAEDQKDDVHNCGDTKPTVTISMPASCTGSCTITASFTSGTHQLKNLYFKIDGNTLAGGSFDISGSGSRSYSYEPDTGGSHEFSAQVVDVALYDATATTTSSLTSTPFSLDSATSIGSNIRLQWDDLGGGISYSLNSSGANDGLALSCTPSGSKCTALVPKATFGASGSYTVSIESSNGRTSNPRTASF